MRIKINLLLLIASLGGWLFATSITEGDSSQVLKGGWYHWNPYQYTEADVDGNERLIGLDVGLSREITKTAGFKLNYTEVGWKQHIADIKEGKRDIAAGATKTPQREEFAYFSEPYREEENSLFIANGSSIPTRYKSVQEFLDYVKTKELRLGVTDGFIYATPIINEFIADPANASLIQIAPDEGANVIKLTEGKIDAFLADRISATTFMWRLGKSTAIKEVRLNISTPIHFMLSKKSVALDTVEKINEAIKKVKELGQYGAIVSEQLFTVLLMQTIANPWFLVIDIIGTIAFAISGLLIAYREKSTLFGAFVMAILPSVGGGVIRDVLVQRPRLGIFLSPTYVYVVTSTVVLTFLLIRVIHLFNKKTHEAPSQKTSKAMDLSVQVFDAMGLAAYTITGVIIAVISKLDPLWIWGPAMAVLTGAGGGIVRDLLRSDRHITALKDELYAEVALVWGLLYSLFLTWQKDGINADLFFNAIIIVMAGVFVTRMIAVYFNIKSISFTVAHNPVLKNR